MSAVATVHSSTTLGPVTEAQCMPLVWARDMSEPMGSAAALSRSGVAFSHIGDPVILTVLSL